MGQLVQITDASFEQEISGSTPTLVDFWAEWCGPCRMVAPVLEQIASEQNGKLRIVKLNVDENQQTTINFGVRGIPAVMLFKGGQIVESVVGLAPKEEFKKAIDKHI